MDKPSFTLIVNGEVDRPLVLRWEEIMELPLAERTEHIDCMGFGFRHSGIVKALPLLDLLEMSEARDNATSAIFHCADGYHESASLLELLEQEAFLAYPVNSEGADEHDCLPRVAIPGKYGYRWAKWLQRVQIVAGEPDRWEQAPSVGNAPQNEPGQVARAFPLPPSCCALYVWGRQRLWRPASPT